MAKEFEKYQRKSIFSRLKQFDHLAKEHDYIEVTEWQNGEGFDIEISSSSSQRFQLTHGELDALKYLIKKIYKDEL